MPIDITLQVKLSIQEEDLEDALAEYDELSISSMVSQILDKSIALESVSAQVTDGPDTLEAYDAVREVRGG
jgi:hypothetical protein